ncbi:hypothetical protein EIP91_010283 [Steccherinum ochraceum]|uniref:F-box domain-containing protein n=1 Tax=Steccherinum ochraceum TaxID=92696 RepID=A0A4R0RX28_9APHY|nr:hypothetical protein EIP91_010283 [Steccherinum ochraceum]
MGERKASGPEHEFPQELVDHIMDYYHADHETLRKFALVSREWLPTARFHLFHTVQVPANYDRVVSLADAPDAVRPLVQHLKIGVSKGWFDMPRSTPISLDNILSAVYRFPNLRTLLVGYMARLDGELVPATALSPPPLRLKALKLQSIHVQAHHLNILHELVQRLGSIEELEVSDLQVGPWGNPYDYPLALASQGQKVRLKKFSSGLRPMENHTEHFLDGLATIVDVSALEELSFRCDGVAHPLFSSAINASSTSLKVLSVKELEKFLFEVADDKLLQYDLSNCHALESLNLAVRDLGPFQVCILNTLARIPPPSALSSILITVHVGQLFTMMSEPALLAHLISAVDRGHWESVGAMIRQRMPRLRSVDFHINHMVEDGFEATEVEEKLRSALKLPDACGLSFTYHHVGW